MNSKTAQLRSMLLFRQNLKFVERMLDLGYTSGEIRAIGLITHGLNDSYLRELIEKAIKNRRFKHES